jgi:hypothetical protein
MSGDRKERQRGGAFARANLTELGFERQLVDRGDGQIDEEGDTVLEVACRQGEGASDINIRTLYRSRVLDAPMGCHRMAEPDRAGFAGRIVTDGEDEVHLRSASFGKDIPAFRAEPGCGIAKRVQSFQRPGMDLPLRMAASREGAEAAFPLGIEDGFRQDRACGIARAKKKHIINAVGNHCRLSLAVGAQQEATSAAGAQISGWPEQQSSIRKRTRPPRAS